MNVLVPRSNESRMTAKISTAATIAQARLKRTRNEGHAPRSNDVPTGGVVQVGAKFPSNWAMFGRNQQIARPTPSCAAAVVPAAGQAAGTLGVKGEQFKNAQVRAMEQCRGYVRDHPVTSLGIAIAAGFLLSRLWTSR